MKTLKQFSSLLVFVLLFGFFFQTSTAWAAEGKPSKDVASFTPTGSVANNVALKITFKDAMAAKNLIGETLSVAEFPFEVTPSLSAEGKWLDARTFQASLLEPLSMATAYSAKTKAGLKTLRGREIASGTYSFETSPLSLVSVGAAVLRSGEADIRLNFNIPVAPMRLRGFLSITDEQERKVAFSVPHGIPSKTLHISLPINRLDRTLRLNVTLLAGLTGDAGSLGLSRDETRIVELRPTLQVESVSAYDGSIRIETNFGMNLDSLGGFIEVEPAVEFTLDSWYNRMFVIRGNFKPRERFVVTLKKGLPAENNGIVLEDNFVQAIIMPDADPNIDLPSAGSGTLLSPVGGGRVPVELTNVRNLKLQLWRLYENNIPYAMGISEYFQRDLARRVASRSFSVSLPPNEKVRRSIAISELTSEDHGLFLLSLTNPDYEEWYESTQIINMSDVGITVRLWEDGVLVWANTISSIKPIEDADVRVYSAANQLLADGKTDKDGLWVFRGQVWGKDDESPSFATVSKGNDVSYVKLTRGLLSRESFDTSGRAWLREGYDAALFSARDIYRTGEHASFKAIVREHDLSLPGTFPVLFVVRNPLDRTVKRGAALLSEEGGAVFDLDIPNNAMTGVWNVSLYIPGDESRDKALSSMTFHVEDFAPPRIEVSLSTDKQAFISDEDEKNKVDISARYLFGADGANLKWEAFWVARPVPFAPKNPKWSGYVFGDPENDFKQRSDEIEGGVLDNSGQGVISFGLPDDLDAPSVIEMTLTGRVMEDGARPVSKSLKLPFYPCDTLLGIAAPSDLDGLSVNRDARFRLSAIKAKSEEAADLPNLSATLYRVNWNYNLVEVDGYQRWQSSEELVKIEEKTVPLKDGIGEVVFKPKRWGTYLIRVTDEHEYARASTRFYADDPDYAGGGSQLLDRVEIKADKELYEVGDVAKVTIAAPFEGLLLFNVEAAGLIDRKIVKVGKAETVVEVPITENMTPNAWCAAWLIRPVVEGEEWGAHRAAGIKRLDVDTAKFRLGVTLDAPDKIEPSKKLPVTITLKNASGEPFKGEIALALVDDGVLGLTSFKTPDLLSHFLAARKMNSNGYDVYDQLMPLESRNTELMHPSGGLAEDAMAAFALSSKAQRFKILSIFECFLKSDENGVVKTEVELSEFSGRGRLFAVATSGARFGSAERMVQIARDVVTEADLPRFAAPGDVFYAPLTCFNTSDTPKDVSITLLANDSLTIHDKDQPLILEASVPANGKRVWSVKFGATQPGTAVYNVKTDWRDGGADKTYKQTIEMPVRSPFPVVTVSGSGVFKSGETKIDLSAAKNSLSRPQTGKFTLSETPVSEIVKAVNFLSNYPYGCLEQTISSAWPFIVLPDVIAEIDPLLVQSDVVKRKIESALIRVQTTQLYDGSFARWPGGAEPYNWGSVYAAHFLAEARKAGVDYPEEMLAGALSWLKQFMASQPAIPVVPSDIQEDMLREDFTAKAYAAYVLTLVGEKPLGWLHYLKENEERMWPSGRIWLAGAESLIDGRGDALRNLGNVKSGLSSPSSPGDTLESDARNTAQLLSLWSAAEPDSDEAAGLAQKLLSLGRENKWYSTQENAVVAMALGRYISNSGLGRGIGKGGDNTPLTAELTDDDGRDVALLGGGKTTALDVNELPDLLSIKAKGSGQGYYAWTITGTPLTAPYPEKKGITVDCVWSDRNGAVFNKGEPISQGTEVVVTLFIMPFLPLNDVVVSCLLPSGFEIENTRLLNTGEEETYGVRREARDDRMLLFIDRVNKPKAVRFITRAVTKGTFVIPPVAAEGMYDAGVKFVASSEGSVVIK
ncbi:membrane protein [Synergistales bacterium]|nr:membrane protein [Synergistales bacterium]